jgi:cytochrome bd-type quinol oxidase subunit 1
LTLGLKPSIVVLKTLALRTNGERYDKAARFSAKIVAITLS